MIKLSDYVFKFIANKGVKHVFYLPGGGAMHLVDSLGRNEEIEHICMLHEQAVSIAAESYAMNTNNFGVGLVTTGPGGTNSVTGVAGAWIDSTPCLFISGQVKRSDMIGNSGVRQMGSQEIDIVSIVKPITKYAVTVLEPKRIKYYLEKAVYLCKNGRPGPVWLDIPLDVQGSMVEEDELISFDPIELEQSLEVDSEKEISDSIGKIIDLINSSERPMIIGGNGIKLSNSQENFVKLLEKLGIPVLTTWKAADLIYDEFPLYAGRFGTMGERGANFAVQNCDLLICLSTRMDMSETGYDTSMFARSAKKVMIDIDKSEIKKLNNILDVSICSDISYFISKFIEKLDNVDKLKKFSEWIHKVREWKEKYPIVLDEYRNSKEFINPYVLIDELSKQMQENEIIVPCSAGTTAEIFFQAIKIKKGQKVRSNHGFGAMGYDIPSSIGACIANDKKRTICVAGDGGMQLNIQELQTIKGNNLPIKIFVVDNSGYSSIRTMQRNYFGGFYVGSEVTSGLTVPNMMNMAKAYGIKAVNISHEGELKEKIDEVLQFNGPVICDVHTIPDCRVSPKLSSKKCEDGSMISKPLEDLWPFLDREEFLANMIIPPMDEKK